jgi:hypothetical protein
MTVCTESRRGVLPLLLLLGVFLATTKYTQGSGTTPGSSSEGPQIGRVLTVRKVLQKVHFVSRYPRIHYFMLYFAVRISDQTLCAEYETPVLDEIDDLFSKLYLGQDLTRKPFRCQGMAGVSKFSPIPSCLARPAQTGR